MILNKRLLAISATLLIALPVLAGCNDEPKLSTQEKAEFKGGPMPPEAAKGMAERMKAAGGPPSAPASAPATTPGSEPATTPAAKQP